jgi:glyceraldehyde 3-phosphate dehydrogenase (phosphorylating)
MYSFRVVARGSFLNRSGAIGDTRLAFSEKGDSPMAKRVAINGFGRIGRNFFRAYLKRDPDFEVVAINDLASDDVLAHMLKYDSTHGVLSADVSHGEGELIVDGSSVRVLSEREPAALPWGDMDVDVVVESTGLFTDREGAQKHLDAGAKKIIISAPATDPDVTLVLGVNDDAYDPDQHHIVSNASCTTNCVAPMAKVLMDEFGIETGSMTTIHAYTTEQQLQDQIALTRKGKPDLRRMRAAPQSIIPSTTGAAKATSLVIPELKGKLDGMAMRVPVPDGSVTDLVCILEREVTAEEINDAYRKAAGGLLSPIMVYTEDPIVSADIIGNPASCILDGLSTMASGRMAKVIGWYDNEWGYSCRLADVTERVAASVGEAVGAQA